MQTKQTGKETQNNFPPSRCSTFFSESPRIYTQYQIREFLVDIIPLFENTEYVTNSSTSRETMGKPRPHKKKASKSKSALRAGNSKMNEDPSKLLEQATLLLQTGQPDEALSVAQRALELASNSPLSALNTVAEVYIELGEIDVAREHLMRAVELDPNGTIPESQGGGSEKFLWLSQLSEKGGLDSVKWFEKGVSSLRHTIQQLEGTSDPENLDTLEEKRRKLANALCGVAEIYMTDLS